jgi:hypothetical protein
MAYGKKGPKKGEFQTCKGCPTPAACTAAGKCLNPGLRKG